MMYAEHMPIIRRHGFRDAQGLRDVLTFVLLSIRVPFVRVSATVREVRQRGEKASALWGWKLQGWQYLRDNADDLLEAVHGALGPVEAIGVLCQVPGLGLVKGGFAAQLLGFPTGCLDGRNQAEFGIPARAWRTDGLQPCTRKILAYCAEVDRLGGAEFLWDTWCAGLAEQEKMEPERISRMHVDMICGKGAK